MRLITIEERAEEALATWKGEPWIAIWLREIAAGTLERTADLRPWQLLCMRCDECQEEDRPVVIELGEPRGIESNTAQLCLPCLQKAVALTQP